MDELVEDEPELGDDNDSAFEDNHPMVADHQYRLLRWPRRFPDAGTEMSGRYPRGKGGTRAELWRCPRGN